MSEHNEQFYDEEIAPKLLALASQCRERGMSLIAVVEYGPHERGATYSVLKEAGIEMGMIEMCSRSAPNIDAYVINLTRYAKQHNIDISSSFTLGRFAVKEPS